MTQKPPPVSRAGVRNFAIRELTIRQPVASDPNRVTPEGEAPLLCEACSAGCIGHGRTGVVRCESHGCECPRKRPALCDAIERRWTALANSGRIAEDANIIATAMRAAADAYIGFAQAETNSARVRDQFLLQAAQCITIAEAIEP